MPDADSLSPQRVADLVLANRAIRAPYYQTDHDEGVAFTDLDRGLQWGADAIPALMGLFRVEPDPRADRPDGWVCFARHWRGGTMRLDVDLVADADEPDPILVVTAISGREGTDIIEDEAFGEIELPEAVPTEAEWDDRSRRYQKARRDDDSDGAAAVRAYVAALPGWKRDVATRFDELIGEELPEVRRAVKYHQPFYGVADRGWFASFSAFTNHVKLSFVCESYLEPRPPSGTGPTRQALDVAETDDIDDEQVASWIRQAAEDPGMGW